jgi:putative transposase
MRLENDMKKSRFTESQILTILKQGESGVPVADLCRDHGISNATYYNWRSKYGGMDASLMAEMKAMAEENRRLKKMYAEMAMQNELLKDALGKKALRPSQRREMATSAVPAARCEHCACLPDVPDQRKLLSL